VPNAGSAGCLDATKDAALIEKWWTQNPRCNIGLATDGLVAVDQDPDGKDFIKTLPIDDLLCYRRKTA
jgi:hypothetical protein